MAFFKKLFFLFFNILIKIINIFGILITIFLSVILYVIIFEIPINFFNKYIQEHVFHNLVQIEKINLKWDYNIKKPVLVLNNINYSNPQNNLSFAFNYLGISFDIKKLLVEHKFYPIYVNLEGFNLYVLRNKDNTITFNIDETKDKGIKDFFNKVDIQQSIVTNKNLVNNPNKSSFLDNLTIDKIQKVGMFDIIKLIKKEYKILSLLNTVDIDCSNILYKDNVTSKVFIANISNINISYNSISNKIFLKSSASIEDISSNKVISIKGNITADNKKNIFFNYSIENIYPQLLLLYSNIHLSKKILTAGLNINANLEGRYQFPFGLKSMNADILVNEGEIFYKKLLLDKLKINIIKTQLSYNASSGKINIPYFSVNFSQSDPLKPKFLNGGDLKIKNVQFKGSLDLNNNLYNFNNIKINLLDKILVGEINSNKGDTSFTFETTNAININEINALWSSSYLSKLKSWVMNNIQKGTINKVHVVGNFLINSKNIKMNNIYGTVLASDLKVIYVNGMPAANADKAILEFDDKYLNIKYFEANTGNILSKNGEVIIANEYPDKNGFHPVIKVYAKAEGKVIDGLLFINNPPLNILNKIKLNAYRFTGDIAGNIYLKYSVLDHKLKNMDVNLTGHDVSFKEAFKNRDVTKANINVIVKNDTFISYGTGEYYNMPVNIYIDANWNPSVDYILKLNIDSKDVPIEKIKNLDLLPLILSNKLNGYVDLYTEMLQLKKSNQRTITTSLDLTNTEIYSFPYLDYSKSAKDPLNAIVNLCFIDNKLTEIKQLTLNNKELSAQMKIAFNEDKSKNIVINSFIMKDKANVKGYLYLSKNNFNINLTGKYLNFEWVREGIDKEKIYNTKMQNIESNSSENSVNTSKNGNYVIKANIKKVESNTVSINNFYTNIDYYNDLNSLVISGDINSNDNITVVYDKNTRKIAYNISNLGEALKFLKLSTKIKKGNLNGQINYNKDKLNNVLTDGIILIKSFSLGVIPFSSANIAFTSHNYDFNIMNLVLKGNVVGGTLSGTFKAKNNYLSLTGWITPIWSTSNLLVNIPILGDFLKSNFAQFFLSSGVSSKDKDSKVNKGAVNIPFSIYGNISDLQYVFSQTRKGKQYKLVDEFDGNLINPSYYTDGIFDIFEFKGID